MHPGSFGQFATLVALTTLVFGAQASGDVGRPPEGDCDPLFDEECLEGTLSLAHFPDPLEQTNRQIFEFNRGFDRFVLDPFTLVYQTLIPEPLREALLRVVRTLDAPSIMVNDGLQLEWRDSAITLQRFVVNSTVGLGGLFDPAASLGLARHHSDFGQTLSLAGIPSGPYMIVPILGPTNARDGAGILADLAMSPLLYILGPFSFEIYRQSGQGLAVRAEAQRDLKLLERESVDFYAAFRNAFYQNRQAEIWSRREHRRPSASDGPS